MDTAVCTRVQVHTVHEALQAVLKKAVRLTLAHVVCMHADMRSPQCLQGSLACMQLARTHTCVLVAMQQHLGQRESEA